MRRANLLAATALVTPAFLGLTFAVTSVHAACSPNPATADNQTITCTGTENSGFDAATFDELTVDVRQGAVVIGSGVQAIFLNDRNRVTNDGTVLFDVGGIDMLSRNVVVNNGTIAGFGFFGIGGEDNNRVVNNGTITGTGFGISLDDGNTVINNGLIIAGDGAAGIEVFDNNGLILNNGTIRAGILGAGMVAEDDNAAVVNAGSIAVGAGGSGMALRFDNRALNLGSIRVGIGGVGMEALAGNLLRNLGTIAASDGAVGIAGEDGNRLINNGLVDVGRGGVGILAFDGNFEVTNNGAIVVGAGSAGIAARDGNLNVNNNGTVITGAGGTGIALGDGNIFINNGLVRVRSTAAGNNGISLDTGAGNFAGNAGTLDGIIAMSGGTLNLLSNAGLITITDPGTTIGVRHRVNGAFEQTADGTLALRVRANTAHDAFSVIGAADLAGNVRAVIQRELYANTTMYDGVVTTAGFIGGLSATSSSPFFNAEITPVGTSFDLTLTRIALNEASGVSPNHQSIARALENGYSPGLAGNAATLYGNILAASSTDVFGFLSGEGTAAAQNAAFGSGGMFQSTMLNQMSMWLNGWANTPGAPLSYAAAQPAERAYDAFAALKPTAAPQQTWQVWSGGFVGNQKLDGDAAFGTASSAQTNAGGAIGVNYSAAPDVLVGFSAGASSAAFSVNERATSGDVKGIHLGAFGVKTWDAFYVAGAIGYARLDNRTERQIFSGGPTETVTGDFGGDLLTGRLEAGWRRSFGAYAVTPFVAIEAAQLWQESYTETSTGVGALSYDANSVTSLPASLGIQIDNRILTANGQTLQTFARVAWVHEFKAERSIEASFVSIPSVSFSAQGPGASEDVAKVTAGAKLSLTRSAAVFANFDGEFSGGSQSYSGSGGLSWVW